MAVDDVYDGHRAEHEEECCCHITKAQHKAFLNEGEGEFVCRHLCELREACHELRDVCRRTYHKELLGIEQEDEP